MTPLQPTEMLRWMAYVKKKWTIFLERTYCCRKEPVLKTALLYTLQQSGQLGHVWSRPLTLTEHLLWTPRYILWTYEASYVSLSFPFLCLIMPLLSLRLCRCMTHNTSTPTVLILPLGHLTVHYTLLFVDFNLISSFMHLPCTIPPHRVTHTESHDSSFISETYLTWWIIIVQNWSWVTSWSSCFWLLPNPAFPYMNSSHFPKVPTTFTISQLSSTVMTVNPGLQSEGINLSPWSLSFSSSYLLYTKQICSVS